MKLKEVFTKISGVFSFKTIRSKLLTAFLLNVIPVIALGIVSYSISKNSIMQKAQTAAIDALTQSKNYLELMFRNLDSVSMQMFTDSNLQEYVKVSRDDLIKTVELKDKIDKTISGLIINFDFISDINIVLENQISISSSSYNLSVIKYADFLEDELTKKLRRLTANWYSQGIMISLTRSIPRQKNMPLPQ